MITGQSTYDVKAIPHPSDVSSDVISDCPDELALSTSLFQSYERMRSIPQL
ncbi:13324_t:CDS:1, partial [Rhizophagus irregularis]